MLKLTKPQEEYPSLFNEIFLLNNYKAFGNELKESIIIDIGSNVGYFSIFAALNGAKQVFSIEPQKDNYNKLISNISSFHNIIPINVAISKPGLERAYVQLPFENSKQTDFQISEDIVGDVVCCISLEEFIKKYIADSVDDIIMKIDCEGSEYDIIFPCPPLVLKRFKYIYSEIHSGKVWGNNLISEEEYKRYNPIMFEKFMNNLGFLSEETPRKKQYPEDPNKYLKLTRK